MAHTLDGECANILGIKAQKREANILAPHKQKTTMTQFLKANSVLYIRFSCLGTSSGRNSFAKDAVM